MPLRRRSGRHSVRSDPRPAPRRASQIGDSSTSRLIHSTARAGSTPTKKTARQPKRGSTTSVTPAAIISPIAHVDCIRPSALPRCSGGQISAMSAAPVVHSPPIPSPSTKRKNASWVMVCDKPLAKLASEYDQDRGHQRAGAAHPVGDHAEAQAADRRGDEREGVQEPGLGFAHPEVEHQLREHHGVEHHVHGVEHPAEAARDERALLGRADRLGPLQHAEDAPRAAAGRRIERVHECGIVAARS